jgi:simple sugar transport system substrate-binding protein
VGFSYPTANNEFWKNALTYVNQAATAIGFKVDAKDCNNDQAQQVTDVDNMISSGINALVLGPQDASVCAGITASCKAKNIPVVIIDRWPGDDLKAGTDYVCFIGPNDQQAGYDMATSLIKGGCKKLVGIGGYQGTSVAEGRKAGLDKALKEHPEVKLLQYMYAGENWDDGDKAFRNLYQAHPDLDGVWCYNDSLALASVNVLKEEKKISSVKVGGMDLLSPAVKSMTSKELWFSTGGHYLQAAFGAVIAYDVASGISYTGQKKIQLDLLCVDQTNVAKFSNKYGDGKQAIDWTNITKTKNPKSTYTFKLSLD